MAFVVQDNFEHVDWRSYRNMSSFEKLAFQMYISQREHFYIRNGCIQPEQRMVAVLNRVETEEIEYKVKLSTDETDTMFKTCQDAARFLGVTHRKVSINYNKTVNGYKITPIKRHAIVDVNGNILDEWDVLDKKSRTMRK